MAALIAALALAWSAPSAAAATWSCARNFTVGASQGLAAQQIAPDDAISGIGIQVWEARAGGARLRWDIPRGSRFAPPTYFTWQTEIPPPTEALWVRYWGDGRFVGQELLVRPEYVRRARRQRIWSISTADPQILAALIAADHWEVDIVNPRGVAIARQTVPLPAPGLLRTAIEAEIDWLESVIRTRAPPCQELFEDADI